VKTHLHYECGETQAGLAYLKTYQAGLDRAAQLHCHVSWHVGLWALDTGDLDTMWRVIEKDIAPDVSQSPPINVLTDSAALLARAELRGVDVPKARWRMLSAYASQRFPEQGIAFADVHAALAHAMAGEGETLTKIVRDARGPAADIVHTVAEAFGAYARGAWAEAVDRFARVMSEHERIGASRAQRDLVEYAMTGALLRLGRAEEAARFLDMRRPHTDHAGSVVPLRVAATG
jgi:hypothetical protein